MEAIVRLTSSMFARSPFQIHTRLLRLAYVLGAVIVVLCFFFDSTGAKIVS